MNPMNRKQWMTILLGVLALLADGAVVGVYYVEFRFLLGNRFQTIGAGVSFFAPGVLFAIGVITLTIILVLAMRSK